nr:hypothetical protein GCM10020093_094280 [Planobispora longispora]
MSRLLLWIGDIPMRTIYGVGATLAAALAVFLAFVFFSGDVPESPTRAERVRAAAPSTPAAAAPGSSCPGCRGRPRSSRCPARRARCWAP